MKVRLSGEKKNELPRTSDFIPAPSPCELSARRSPLRSDFFLRAVRVRVGRAGLGSGLGSRQLQKRPPGAGILVAPIRADLSVEKGKVTPTLRSMSRSFYLHGQDLWKRETKRGLASLRQTSDRPSGSLLINFHNRSQRSAPAVAAVSGGRRTRE